MYYCYIDFRTTFAQWRIHKKRGSRHKHLLSPSAHYSETGGSLCVNNFSNPTKLNLKPLL